MDDTWEIVGTLRCSCGFVLEATQWDERETIERILAAHLESDRHLIATAGGGR